MNMDNVNIEEQIRPPIVLGDNRSSRTAVESSHRQLSRVSELFRAPKLQILDYAASWRSPLEHRKVAIRKSRRVAAFHTLLHAIPVTAAITLLTLNCMEYYIGPSFNYTTRLQFVAKAHELLMQASIVEVLLCFIRTLAVDKYIPLGALSAAMQAYQISYIWSLEFLSTIRSRGFAKRNKVIFVILAPLLMLLMVAVGPSSAVLMIPRPNTIKTMGPYTIYTTELNLSPTLVNGTTYARKLDFFGLMLGYRYSERYRYSDDPNITSIIHALINFGAGPQRVLRCITSRRADDDYPQDWRFSAIATIPTSHSRTLLDFQSQQYTVPGELTPYPIARSHAQLYSSNITFSTRLPQPVVVVRCTPIDGVHVKGDEGRLLYIKDDGTTKGSVPKARELIENHLRSGSIKNISPDSIPPLWMPSPEAGSSSLIGILTNTDDDCDMSQGSLAAAMECLRFQVCTISAFWTPFETELVFLEETWAVRIVSSLDIGFGRLHYKTPITIDLSGISQLNNADFSSMVHNISNGVVEPLLATVFASIVSEVFDEYNSGRPFYFRAVYKEDTPVPYDAVAILYGYGYGAPSPSVRLALAVLIIYCIIVFGYLLYIYATGYTSTAWNSVMEFVLLALQSNRPDHLGHTSVGINSVYTYQEGVGVRVNSEERLELVFACDRDIRGRNFGKIEPNKAY